MAYEIQLDHAGRRCNLPISHEQPNAMDAVFTACSCRYGRYFLDIIPVVDVVGDNDDDDDDEGSEDSDDSGGDDSNGDGGGAAGAVFTRCKLIVSVLALTQHFALNLSTIDTIFISAFLPKFQHCSPRSALRLNCIQAPP